MKRKLAVAALTQMKAKRAQMQKAYAGMPDDLKQRRLRALGT